MTNTDRFVSTPGDMGHPDDGFPLVSVRDLARHLGVERSSRTGLTVHEAPTLRSVNRQPEELRDGLEV